MSPFLTIEAELYKKFVAARKACRKVSSSWIRIYAMKIFNEQKRQVPNLQSIDGWLFRFIKRRKIKFRRRKCGKEKTLQDDGGWVMENEFNIHDDDSDDGEVIDDNADVDRFNGFLGEA